MSDSRATYHHGDLRRALIEAAVALIAEQGPEAFTLREAARRVGVNHRAVYRHFADKSALLAAVAEQGYRELLTRMERAQERAPDIEAELHALGRAYVKFALERPADYRVMFGPRLNEDGRFPALEAEVQRAYAHIAELVARGVREGVLAPSSEVAVVTTLWSALHGFASLALMRRVHVSGAEVPRYTDRVLAPTIRGLLRR